MFSNRTPSDNKGNNNAGVKITSADKEEILRKQRDYYSSAYLEIGVLGFNADPNAHYLSCKKSQPGGKCIYGGRARLFLYLPDTENSINLLKKHSFCRDNVDERRNPENKNSYGYYILRHRLIDGSLMKQYVVMLSLLKNHANLIKEFEAYQGYISHQWDKHKLEELIDFGLEDANKFFVSSEKNGNVIYSETEKLTLLKNSCEFNNHSYKIDKSTFDIFLVDESFVNEIRADKIYDAKLRNHFYLFANKKMFFINNEGHCKQVNISEKAMKFINYSQKDKIKEILENSKVVGIKGKLISFSPLDSLLFIDPLDLIVGLGTGVLNLISEVFHKLPPEDKKPYLNVNRRTFRKIYHKTRRDNYNRFLLENKEEVEPSDIEQEHYFQGTGGNNEFSIKLFFVEKIMDIKNIFINSYEFDNKSKELNEEQSKKIPSWAINNSYTHKVIQSGTDFQFYWYRNCSAKIYEVLEKSLNKEHPLYNEFLQFFPKNKFYPVTPLFLYENMAKLSDFVSDNAISDIVSHQKAIAYILENAIGRVYNSWDKTILGKIQNRYKNNLFSLNQQQAILKQIQKFKAEHDELYMGMSVDVVDATLFSKKIVAIASKRCVLGIFQLAPPKSSHPNDVATLNARSLANR